MQRSPLAAPRADPGVAPAMLDRAKRRALALPVGGNAAQSPLRKPPWYQPHPMLQPLRWHRSPRRNRLTNSHYQLSSTRQRRSCPSTMRLWVNVPGYASSHRYQLNPLLGLNHVQPITIHRRRHLGRSHLPPIKRPSYNVVSRYHPRRLVSSLAPPDQNRQAFGPWFARAQN